MQNIHRDAVTTNFSFHSLHRTAKPKYSGMFPSFFLHRAECLIIKSTSFIDPRFLDGMKIQKKNQKNFNHSGINDEELKFERRRQNRTT